MIHFFIPLTIQYLPSSLNVAEVVIPCTSEPACGSEMASEMNFLPLSHPDRQLGRGGREEGGRTRGCRGGFVGGAVRGQS